MNYFKHQFSWVGALRLAALLVIASSCLSCASLFRFGGSTCGEESKLDVRHIRVAKSSDCLVACVNMVLQYYNVPKAVPDSTSPVEMISFTHHLNAQAITDEDGNRVIAAIMQMSSEDFAAQLAKRRPLILIYRPSSQEVYHSVVVSGFCPERDRFLLNDPMRKKPQWKALSKIPTFADTGKYLVLLVGLERS